VTVADITSQIAVTIQAVKAWKESKPDDLGCSPAVPVDVLWKGGQLFFHFKNGQSFEAVVTEVDHSMNARNYL
jgi:hypothetical protein